MGVLVLVFLSNITYIDEVDFPESTEQWEKGPARWVKKGIVKG